MKISLFPIYKFIFGPKKELLLEKLKANKSKKNLYHLHFFGKEKTTELLISCELNHFQTGLPQITEYMPIKIDVINNLGETDGSEFIEWLSRFFSHEYNRYEFNIYNKNSKDMVIKSVNPSKLFIKKFVLCGCTVKSVVFYEKRDKNNPQMTIELAVKSGFVAE